MELAAASTITSLAGRVLDLQCKPFAGPGMSASIFQMTDIVSIRYEILQVQSKLCHIEALMIMRAMIIARGFLRVDASNTTCSSNGISTKSDSGE